MSAAPKPVPAAFLKPPRRERKHFTDEPLFEAPVEADRNRRRLVLVAQAWPDGQPHERRRWAQALSYLLTGRPGRSRPLEWRESDKRKRRG